MSTLLPPEFEDNAAEDPVRGIRPAESIPTTADRAGGPRGAWQRMPSARRPVVLILAGILVAAVVGGSIAIAEIVGGSPTPSTAQTVDLEAPLGNVGEQWFNENRDQPWEVHVTEAWLGAPGIADIMTDLSSSDVATAIDICRETVVFLKEHTRATTPITMDIHVWTGTTFYRTVQRGTALAKTDAAGNCTAGI